MHIPQTSFMSLTIPQHTKKLWLQSFLQSRFTIVIYFFKRSIVLTSGCFRIFTVVDNDEIGILFLVFYLHVFYYFLRLNFQVKWHTSYNFDTSIVRLPTRIIRPIYFHYCQECFKAHFSTTYANTRYSYSFKCFSG